MGLTPFATNVKKFVPFLITERNDVKEHTIFISLATSPVHSLVSSTDGIAFEDEHAILQLRILHVLTDRDICGIYVTPPHLWQTCYSTTRESITGPRLFRILIPFSSNKCAWNSNLLSILSSNRIVR